MKCPTLFAAFAFASLACGQVLPPEARIVMSHFKSDGGGGDERLYISWSADGLNWTGLNNNNPVWQPPGWAGFGNVVRDPTIIFHDGFYWVAYTSGTYGRGAHFGLVKSADLLNWTFVISVDAALPGAPDQFTWSPIFFEDGDGSVHVIVAISPTNGSTFSPVPDMRVHETHPLNADWTQWSTPVPLELPDTNNNDCWVWKEGSTYHAAYADFARGGAVVHATSQHLVSGWVRDKVLGFNSQEGNIVLPIPGGGYRLYLERGNGPGNTPTTYTTCDFAPDFTNPTPQVLVNSTIPMRNGKVCAVHGGLSYAQWAAQALPDTPPAKREPAADPDEDGLPNALEHALATDPLTRTPPSSRPEPYLREIADIEYPGLRFHFLRASSDIVATAEMRIGNGPWSSTDLSIESLTLMSDGTTQVHALANTPIGADPVLLRLAAAQQPPVLPAVRKRHQGHTKERSAICPPSHPTSFDRE